jgi:hypothetical protein
MFVLALAVLLSDFVEIHPTFLVGILENVLYLCILIEISDKTAVYYVNYSLLFGLFGGGYHSFRSLVYSSCGVLSI